MLDPGAAFDPDGGCTAAAAADVDGDGVLELLVARGDGPLAGVSLEAALRCDPRHRMAGMLDTALHSGLRPEHIRELAVTGYRLADRLGVRLPPQQTFRRRAV